MASKVKCEETKQEKTKCMTDKDFLYDILVTEKDIVTNTVSAITEASNRKLENLLLEFFDKTEALQRDIYETYWSNGWYELEEAETKKLKEASKKMNQRMDELSN